MVLQAGSGCCLRCAVFSFLLQSTCVPSLGHSLFRLPTCCAHGCRNAHRPEFEVSVGGPGIVVFLLSFLFTLHDLGPRGSKARIHLLRTWLVEVWRPGSPRCEQLGDEVRVRGCSRSCASAGQACVKHWASCDQARSFRGQATFRHMMIAVRLTTF